MAGIFETYLSLKERLDGEGIVAQYKDFVVTVEFVAGPSGEWHEYSVFGLLDDPEEYDFFHCRLEAMDESVGQFETEGEALAEAFRVIESQYLPQKEV